MNHQSLPIYFETIRMIEKKALHLPYHHQRIFTTIHKKYPLEALLNPPSDQLYRTKVIYNVQEILDISYTPYTPKKINSFKLIFCDTIEYPLKFLDRSAIDTLYTQKGECDEIIIVKNGFLSDTSIANIALYLDGVWLTPKTPLLQGTSRARLLKENFLKEKDLQIKDLFRAQKIALCNAMIDFLILEKKDFILKN